MKIVTSPRAAGQRLVCSRFPHSGWCSSPPGCRRLFRSSQVRLVRRSGVRLTPAAMHC